MKTIFMLRKKHGIELKKTIYTKYSNWNSSCFDTSKKQGWENIEK